MDLGQSYVSSEVRGTFGYVDPEYRKNHHVNALGDVYSFGVVLLQVLSGRRVINLNSNTPMSLNKMVRKSVVSTFPKNYFKSLIPLLCTILSLLFRPGVSKKAVT